MTSNKEIISYIESALTFCQIPGAIWGDYAKAVFDVLRDNDLLVSAELNAELADLRRQIAERDAEVQMLYRMLKHETEMVIRERRAKP